MSEIHYKYIKSKSDTKLLFTDTDSLVYEIKTDVYELQKLQKFTKICLILVIIHSIQSFLILIIKALLAK